MIAAGIIADMAAVDVEVALAALVENLAGLTLA